MVGFIFGGDTGETPESAKRKREIAMALLGQSRAPRTVGEGISALGDGIVANIMNRRAGAAEKAGTDAYAADFNSVDWSKMFGGGAAYPSSVAAGGSPTSGAATGTAVASTPEASTIKQGLEARGLPPHVADAFVMNFQDESGLNPGINEKNPIVPGSRGGYGLYQLTGPRRRAYEAFASQRGVDPSNTDAQLDFLMTELQGPEAKAAQAIMSAPDTGTAAQAIVNKFLRPAEQHRAARAAKYANAGGVQVASLDPSIGLPPQGGATIPAGDYDPALHRGNAPADGARATFGGPQLVYDDKGMRFVDEGAQPMPYAPAGGPADPQRALQPMGNSQQPQTATAAINQVAPQQEDPKTAIRDALLRQHDTMFGGALAPQGQAPQQVADASGDYPPAPTGQPFAGQQGGEAHSTMIQKLIQLSANPWGNEHQRAMVNALLQNQMQQADPRYQMGIEKDRLELEAMKNPQAKPMEINGRLVNPQTGQVIADFSDQNQRLINAGDGRLYDPASQQWIVAPEASQKMPDSVRALEMRAERAGLQPGTPEYNQFMISGGAGGTSLQVSPDGSVSFTQGGAAKPLTEGQSKDAVFATRAEGALPLIDQYGAALTGIVGNTAGQLPGVGNYLKPEDFQKAEQAGKEFLQAILRKDTGAAITADETAEYGSVYLPRPGDSPEVLQQKALSRTRALEAIKAGMPPQAILQSEQALKNTNATQQNSNTGKRLRFNPGTGDFE